MTLLIAAVDDHPLILSGLAAELHRHVDAIVDPVFRHVFELIQADPPVDLVLLDLELRDGSDPESNVAAVTGRGYPVLILTQDQRLPLLAKAFRAGAAGVVSKSEDVSVIAEAIRTVIAGQPWFSADWADALLSDSGLAPHLAPRELEIVRMYAGGLPIDSIARRLYLTADTVRTNLMRVRRKYEQVGRPAHDRADLYRRAVADGHLPIPGS